ncbi:MAG: 2-dehydropantoate 2-reductase [bacterium]|nr:2-dehydropantoate 2-reductase [bacterium]
MKVAVIGPGAMGCLFAARLAQGGADVTLVDHDGQRAARLSESGIQVERDGTSVNAKPRVVTAVPSDAEWVLSAVKSHATRSLEFPANASVLTVQNGLGNVETLCSIVGSARVVAGTTALASETVSEGVVKQTSEGVTKLGAWTSCPTEPIVTLLGKSGFAVELTEAPGQTIWHRQAINAGIEPLAALLNVAIGRLLESAETRQLMRDLVVEAVKVASTEGYRFAQSLVELAEEICEQHGSLVPPMLQDIRAGKRTEIDALSGEIVRRAQVAALPTPRTRVVWQLMKALEQR